MARRILFALLASWLALVARSATIPKGEKHVLQEEITPGQFPLELLPQHPIDDEDDEEAETTNDFGIEQVPLPAAFGPRGRPPGCDESLSSCSRDPPAYKLDEFPPAQPTWDNLGNLCAEGRRKLCYGPWNLPQTGFSHLSRQGDALNALESGVSHCCQLPTEEEKLPCCAEAWETSLTQFCKQEFSVKTRPHMCCKERNSQARFECFANQAPYPAYDKETTSVDLAQITPSLLDSLCGPVTLLSKQNNIPILVQNITTPCCPLQGEERILCAQETKSQFITNLCTAQKDTWSDPEKCCAQKEGPARDNCFNHNYLSSVAFASVEQTAPSAEPSA